MIHCSRRDRANARPKAQRAGAQESDELTTAGAHFLQVRLHVNGADRFAAEL
jgi:hypothetical protein